MFAAVLSYRNGMTTGQWWCRPLIPALGRQRQADLYEFVASLIYKSQFQNCSGCYTEKPCLKKTKKEKRKKKRNGMTEGQNELWSKFCPFTPTEKEMSRFSVRKPGSIHRPQESDQQDEGKRWILSCYRTISPEIAITRSTGGGRGRQSLPPNTSKRKDISIFLKKAQVPERVKFQTPTSIEMLLS